MSWDVAIFRAPPSTGSADDLPEDFDPPPLGTMAEIGRRLRDRLPHLDLAEPDWGRLAGPAWSMEVGIGSEDPVASITLYVRGTGDDVLDTIALIAATVGGRALDLSTGSFLDGGGTDADGWHRFQDHRDQIFHQPRP